MLDQAIIDLAQRKIALEVAAQNKRLDVRTLEIRQEFSNRGLLHSSMCVQTIEATCVKATHERAEFAWSILQRCVESVGIVYEESLAQQLQNIVCQHLPEHMDGLRWRVVEAARGSGLPDLIARMNDEVSASQITARQHIITEIDLFVMSLKHKDGKNMSFASLLTDQVSVLKANGNRFDNIAASVQAKKVFINQSTPLIEPGDLIIRSMSNGAEETMRVIDPGFHEQFHGIPAGYQMTVEKLGLPEANKAVQSITYNVHGNNARINHQSVDNSTNIIQEQTDVVRLIAELRSAIDGASLPTADKTDAYEIIDGVEAQFDGTTPKRSIIKAMLAALPDVATIATSINSLTSLAG